ncbi:hypothetical protein M0R72_07845 [Candidatus Pacearchaeota archaeon]|nr:hypothetical protein [Candidatus Pacearchaeota archaeon]
METTTRSFGGQVGQIGTQAAQMGNLIKAGFAAFGGAAALMPVRAVLKEALDSQRQMRDLTTVIMAQGAPGLIATERVAEAQKRIHEVNRQVPGMLDKMEAAAGEMRAAFGDMYLDAFDPIAKLAFVGTQTQDFAAVMSTSAGALYKFRNSLPGKTDLEKLTAVTDAFAKAKAYKLDIAETGNILLRASTAAAVYGADFYDMLSAVAPVVRQTSMPRMAANAVAQTYEALATYSDQVNELKKRPAKKGQAITYGDIVGLNPAEEDKIPKKDRWLLDLKVTNAQGMFLPLADIVDQVTAGAKITKKQTADVDRRVKAGEISGEQAATQGYGMNVETAKWVLKLLGPAFGMYLGHADEMRQAKADFMNSAGLTQSIFATEIEEAAAQADLLKGQFSGLKDQIGDHLTPALGEFLKAINAAATGLGQWMERNPKGASAATWLGTAALGTAVVGSGLYTLKTSKRILGNLGGRTAGSVLSQAESAAIEGVWGRGAAFENPLTMGLTGEPVRGAYGRAISKAVMSKSEQVAALYGEIGRNQLLKFASAYGPQVALGVLTMYEDIGMEPSINNEFLSLRKSRSEIALADMFAPAKGSDQLRSDMLRGMGGNPSAQSTAAATQSLTDRPTGNTFYITQNLYAPSQEELATKAGRAIREQVELGPDGKR